ncbi:alpha/beta hydrolase [Litorisediminicola beolgyonensis]|uniref:Alpha/beta hydrolase n=1 Tax=Litorisediminicola beolgyonensis TaxID=1173614 RepID=A0ABW3ZNZ6_9RHOB
MRGLAIALAVVILIVAGSFAWVRVTEPELRLSFDETQLDEGIDAYLEAAEAGIADLRPAARKRVLWAEEPGARTPLSVVYLHGFLASAEELRPVSERVAEALGANLYFTRFTGHGRDGAAMAEAELTDWMDDAAEALAIGRRIGERVLLVGTSTGGTIAALALAQDGGAEDVAGVVLISPNFEVKNPAATVLTWPGISWWGPLVVGETRSFEPANEEHAEHWTISYPTRALFPMAQSVARAGRIDPARFTMPALFIYADGDEVVDADVTDRVRAGWGGPTDRMEIAPGPGIDPSLHVVAGDILSPAATDPVAARIAEWAGALPAPD